MLYSSANRLIILAIGCIGIIGFSGSAQVATINFPANCGVVDVTKAPYNADNTGQTDATAALQAALDANKKYMVIYLPNGTYKISKTVSFPLYDTLIFGTQVIPASGAVHGPMMVGQNRKLTVIRLADGVFTDAANPRPALITGYSVAQNFDRAVYNLTINTGYNNTGATGMYFYSNNLGLLSDVDIISMDNKGERGLDLGYGEQGPCGVKSVYVKGFKYGIYSDALNAVALTQITLEGQTSYGVYNNNRYLWIDSLTSTNTVPAVINRGDIVLINALCKGGSSSNVAVQNQTGMMFARNITAQGYSRAVSGTGAPTGMTAAEYNSGSTQRLWTESPATSMNLPIKYAPYVPWEEDTAKWACFLKYKGGVGTQPKSDQVALQAAIDDPGKKVVFLPGSRLYQLSDTIFLRGGIERLVGGGASFSATAGGALALVITDQCTSPVIGINWIHGIPIYNRSSKKVVFQSVSDRIYGQGTGEMYVVDICGGVRVMNPRQKLWSWQFNAEGGPMTEATSADDFSLRVDAGMAWIFGWKDEGNGIAAICYGGATEILGFFQYTAPDATHPSEMVVKNAQFSLAGHSQLCWTCSATQFYTTLATETRGTVTRTMSNSVGSTYGLYSAYMAAARDSILGTPVVKPHEPATISTPRIVSAGAGTLMMALGNMADAVRILDCAGRLTYDRTFGPGDSRVFSIANLKSGAYIVQIATRQGRNIGKTVVVK